MFLFHLFLPQVCEIVEKVGTFTGEVQKAHATILTPAVSVCDSSKYSEDSDGISKMHMYRCTNPAHPLEVESIYAVRALRDFATKYFNSKVG